MYTEVKTIDINNVLSGIIIFYYFFMVAVIHSKIFSFRSDAKSTNSSFFTNPEDMINGFAKNGKIVKLNILTNILKAVISKFLFLSCFLITRFAINRTFSVISLKSFLLIVSFFTNPEDMINGFATNGKIVRLNILTII